MKYSDDRDLIGCLVDFVDDNVRQANHDPFVRSTAAADVSHVGQCSEAIGRVPDGATTSVAARGFRFSMYA